MFVIPDVVTAIFVLSWTIDHIPLPGLWISYGAAGKSVEVPALRCPRCLVWLMRWGGYWRWLRAPLRIERIWIRGRCGVCRRTHALLPDMMLARRLDEVAVIGQGDRVEGRC
jgi:hypothetical protein